MSLKLPARLVALLPEGRVLPDDVWHRRHRIILTVAAAQAVALAMLALALGEGVTATAMETAAVLYPLAFALLPGAGRTLRAAAATLSLLAASVLLVYLMDGQTEAHFHFFVVIGLVALYQDWVPFGVALLVVVLHHGVLGTLLPHSVFGHAAAHHHPWTWAGIHAGFVLAASLSHLAAWRLNEQQGLRDPLTGLANRTLLMETTDRLLARTSGEVSMLFLDLDDFKDVNDSRGHAAGDVLLSGIAQRLSTCVRPSDQVARIGGDEFAVVVAGGPEIATVIGQRMLVALADPMTIDGRPHVPHVSIGAASTVSTPERDAGVLLRNADLAMYMAKALGKNRLVHYADGMAQAAEEKVRMLEDLAGAVAGGQLRVHYQPTIRLSDGSTTGYEALLRWEHPLRGMVSPGEFIPLAEEGGLIVEIGRWVLEQAAHQAVAWSAESGIAIEMAVNLSPRQLADDDVVATVHEVLATTGLPAGQLTLEVTEGVLVHDIDTVIDQLQALRRLGVRIAIDDFGTGYSSLSYLRRLPADIIKIDQSFVQDLDAGGASTTLVASIIELARSLRLTVVAEGVETPQQNAVLTELACSHAQGFLFGRPQAADRESVSAAAQEPAPLVAH
ncbi:bifunctional diguanylate cyclase/phosphodiesterase [Blastococcus sp. URHD0036]|uniref:putative bifunctional diguanylate cyclase/phosphodiesterase n=1 Tax=Blastococcus sp. URHD0036 TaxID=1380356 RepID=UPI0004955DF1|nr:EAL domain-containing protein [Blastococcus sp. URHD0036]